MFRYIDKNTLTLIESPVRFDLRLKEHKHLRLYVETGPQQPPQQKKMGYTIDDIACAWGCSYQTLQKNRIKYLPKPDGKFGLNLVWNKLPKSPWEVTKAGFTLQEVAKHNGVSTWTVKAMIKLGEIKDADIIQARFGVRPLKMWSEIPVISKRAKFEIIDLQLSE